MKVILYFLALITILLALNSCFFPSEPSYPPVEPWLCSINADGTGFRKIKKSPFNTPGLVDIYMTKDNRIIFYGEKLWISDTDTIRVEQITPDNLTLTNLPPRVSQTTDGNKLFFAADKNIYQLSYPDYQLTQLTNQSTRWLRNPIVSNLGNYITYSSNGFGYPTKETEYLYCMNLQTGISTIVPTEDSVVANGMYIEDTGYVYYERLGLKKSRLDGTEYEMVDNNGLGGDPNAIFSFSTDRHQVLRWSSYPNSRIRVFRLEDSIANEYPVAINNMANPIAKLNPDSKRVFYVKPDNTLCVYNLDTATNTILFQGNGDRFVYCFHMLAPTWDGSKVYFYAEIAEK
ncbi:MAG: hypothetical protein CVU50_02090 [Candidatus Cloacimonetes bacterium HGW-Cloacimonetes-3]|jgi:hypothetical protein|nr:MAG: hypothetical protein CVU50_02090 [Candidatus Cloacimonetes bacterium HGW-Cloacimonetes-3]